MTSENKKQEGSTGVRSVPVEQAPGTLGRAVDGTKTTGGEVGTEFICPSPIGQNVCKTGIAPMSGKRVASKKRRWTSPLYMAAYFAVLNVVMYLTIHKFWIGGSSFLPMVGKMGPENKFLFAFLVNMGVILGSFIGASTSGEFRLRWPKKENLIKSTVGGFLIGMGVTVAPGTCTTAFVTGMPMLSVSSFLSAAGIFIGAYIVYSYTLGRR